MKSLIELKKAAEMSGGLSISEWYRTKVAPERGFVQKSIPPYINDDLLSEWCDARKIPCLIYMRGEVSFHDTYSELYRMEINR